MKTSPASPAVDARAVLADEFRLAMRKLAATATVVTTGDNGDRCGIAATSVTSLSMSPPSLLVCVNRQGILHDRLRIGTSFCVNVLTEAQSEICRAFAGGTVHEERFAVGEWVQADGAPYLRDAQSAVFCEAADCIAWATHTIVIGSVQRVLVGEGAMPLIYCNGVFRDGKAHPGGPT